MSSAPRVLLVCDPSAEATGLVPAIERSGFDVRVATDADAVRRVLSATEREAPHVLLVDLSQGFSTWGGLGLVEALRGEARWLELPVIALASDARDDEVERAFARGADDVLRLPARPTELCARIFGQLRVHAYAEELARRERDSRVLLEITHELASALDLQSVLFTVARRMADVVQVERCSIVVVSEDMTAAFVIAASDDRSVDNLPLDIAKYPEIRQALQSQKVVFVEDATTHPVLDDVRGELPPDVRALALVPIVFESKAMGVLVLRGKETFALREHELALACAVANAAAIALRNARIVRRLSERANEVAEARAAAEERLRSIAKFADFFQSAADGLVAVDLSWNVLLSNPRARELLGATDEVRGSLLEWLDPASAPGLRSLRGSAWRGERSSPVDAAVRVAPTEPEGGSLRPRACRPAARVLSINVAPLPDESEGALLVSLRDVTSERATAAELVATKELFERVIQSSADAIVAADSSGQVVVFNRAAERVFGRPAGDVVGRARVTDLYPRGGAHEVMRLIRARGGRVEGHRACVVDAVGAEVPVLLSAALILEHGREAGTVGVFTDLRERLGIEAQLTAAREELQQRERLSAVAELAGAAAHELNQPLTAVIGYAQLIARRLPPGSPLERSAGEVVREAERMSAIVRKIGSMTRYETKSYVGSAKIVDLDRSAAPSVPPGLTSGREGDA